MARTKAKPSAAGSSKKPGAPASSFRNEVSRDCLAVRVRALSRTMTRMYDAALRPQGLTAAQLNLLAAIQNQEPAAAGEVARLLSMEISTLSRNAQLMKREGWITVTPAERGNGRVLSLTKAGERKLAEATPAWRHAQKKARALLGDDGADLVKGLVDGLSVDHRESRGRPAA
jgi:DNA-binding MarR family transcriptional regulator